MYTAVRNADPWNVPEKEPSLIRGSIATPSLVAGIMNAKYVNGSASGHVRKVEFARYDLDLLHKDYGELDHKLCRQIPETAVSADERGTSGKQIYPLWRKPDPGTRRTGSERDDPELDVGIVSRMNSVVPRRWYSSIMKGPVRDIIL